MFYNNFMKACNLAGKSPSAVLIAVGISKPAVTRWRKGEMPTAANLQKLADYFGCTPKELLGETSPNPTALSDLDADAIAVAEAYAQADEKSRAMVRLALNLDMDVPLAAHGGPSGKISAKTAEALEKGAVEFTGDI